MTEITMPKLSDSMEEGTISAWLKDEGDMVAAGDDLVEVETDKATMTYAVEEAGVLHIVAEAGSTLPVGGVIATLGDAAAAPASNGSAPQEISSPAVAVEAPVAESPAGTPAHPPAAGTRTSPLARRLARIHGVDLARIAGSGPRGRIVKADVLAAAGVAEPAAPPVPARAPATVAPPAPSAPSAPAEAGAKGEVTVQQPTRLQQVVARRMAEAKATVPEFQVETDVAMDAVLDLRAQLRAAHVEGSVVPSLNDFVVKACALALREHPRANGSYRDGTFELYSRVNVGVAVAAENALVVPTVFDADTKTLSQISRDIRRLAGRVREGEITPPELAGGTFTVSNLGMYGMTAITPVINAPQAAILGVGAAREVLARVDGEIVTRRLATLRLSCDHRILYGADASQFLADIRALLESPLRLAM